MWQSGAAGLAQVAAGFGGFAGPNGLIGGSILGQLAAVLTLEAAVRSGERLLDRLARPRGSPRSLLFRHRDFPIFSSGSGLLQIATDQLPILLIPFLFGSTVAGHFALPARLLQAVVALLSFTTAQAFYPHAARRERDGVLATSCLDIHRTLCRWTLVPLAIGAVVASDGFGMAFGSDWIDSGDYFRRLVPWFFVAIPFASLNQVFPIVGKQRQQLLLNAGVVAVGAGALGAGAVWFDARGTVLLFSATGAAVRIAGIEWALRLAGAPPGKGMLALLLETARALPFLAIQLGVRAFVVPPAASIAVAILLVGVHFARCATSRPQSERRG